MELNPEQLAAQLEKGGLKPIYLVAGAETLRVIEACDAIRAAARASGCSEREVFDVAPAATRESKSDSKPAIWSEIANAINSPSLFSPLRLIEIRIPSGKPGTEGAKFLESLADDVPPGVIALVVANEW